MIRRSSAGTRRDDRRLLGTWRSDARRTLKGWVFPPGLSAPKRRRFARIFGKLTLRYTPSRIISDYEGHRTVDRYVVLGKDPHSVAILAWRDDPRQATIGHIHFDESGYCPAPSPAGAQLEG